MSKDINLRIKADALGLQAEDYETDHVAIKDLYTGTFDLAISPNAFRELACVNGGWRRLTPLPTILS